MKLKCEVRHKKLIKDEPDAKFLTITISVYDDLIYDYKQLPSNTKFSDPTKTGRYCEVCQGYLPFSSLI